MSNKVLIADDNTEMLNLLSNIIEEIDLKPIKANNGQEALDLAQKELPSLIMLDIHMPIKNGIETLKELKKNQVLKNIPVVMLTVEGNPSEIQQCIIYGANTYITKPAEKEDIINIINSFLK